MGHGDTETWGVVLIAQGEPARRQAANAIEHIKCIMSLPVAVIGDKPIQGAQHIYERDEANDPGARWAKVRLFELSPFEQTLYMDADTKAMSRAIEVGFEMLADGWELVITPSERQGHDWLWHVDEDERLQTEIEVEEKLPVMQGGVFFFRKCQAVEALFTEWRREWQRFRGKDQAALLRAIHLAPCRVYLLGRPFNGGELVKHAYGRARR